MWTVYILQCRDGTLYTGITDNLPRRLAAHNAGRGAKYTRGRTPVVPVYQELCPDRSAALRRERAINPSPAPKSWPLPPQPAAPPTIPRGIGVCSRLMVQIFPSRAKPLQRRTVCAARKSPRIPQFPGGSPSLGGTKPPYRMFCFPYGGI